MATVKELLKKLIGKTETVTTPRSPSVERMERVAEAASQEGKTIRKAKGK